MWYAPPAPRVLQPPRRPRRLSAGPAGARPGLGPTRAAAGPLPAASGVQHVQDLCGDEWLQAMTQLSPCDALEDAQYPVLHKTGRHLFLRAPVHR